MLLLIKIGRMMNKNILFIGAGGFASECYMYLQDRISTGEKLNIKGFLSTSNDLEPYGLSHLFLGHYNTYEFKENDYVIIAIGSCNARKNIYEELKVRNVKFYNLISPKAYIPNSEGLGECTIIAPFVTIAANVKFGIGNVVNSHSGIGHDTKLGNFNIISSQTDICGFATIGDENFCGSRISILPHVKIGNNNKISAGSVMYKSCKNNCVMQGVPALKICNTEDL